MLRNILDIVKYSGQLTQKIIEYLWSHFLKPFPTKILEIEKRIEFEGIYHSQELIMYPVVPILDSP